MVNVRYDGFHRDLAIDFPHLAGCGFSFGQIGCHIIFVEQDLTLKIVKLDKVAIHDANKSDSGTCQMIGQNGTERTTSTDCDARCADPFLTFFTKRAESHLPAVSFETFDHL